MHLPSLLYPLLFVVLFGMLSLHLLEFLLFVYLFGDVLINPLTTEDAFWHCLTWPHVIRFKDFARLEDFALPKKVG